MVDLDPHQIDAVRRMKNGSVLRGGVGSGKSRTALAYYFTKVCEAELRINGVGTTGRMAHPTDLYIVTTAKKRDGLDWEHEAAAFGLSPDPTASWGGVAIKVISWNQLTDYGDVVGACFIFDEQRVVGSGAWSKAFIKLAKQNDWILLSATPGDKWEDYIPIFLAHGFYKNRTQFQRDHIVYKSFSKFPAVDHYVEEAKLFRLKREITVEMPLKRHTTRHISNIMVSHDKAKFDRIWKDRWNIYEDEPIKDVGQMFILMRRLVNTDVSRMAAVMELSELYPRLIIFYNWDSELQILRQLRDILDVDVAEWNGHRHQEIPNSDRWLYFVQYQAGAEGWNCVTTNAMVFYSLPYSYKLYEQAQGRTDRMNTPYSDLYYFVLRSSSLIDNSIMRTLSAKKTFNEKKFLEEHHVRQ